MNPLTTRRWLWWFVAAAVATAALGAAASLRSPRPDTPTAPVVAVASPATTSAPLPAATAADTPPPHLVGTAMTSAGPFAIVRQAADARLRQVHVGDRVDGLVVTAIDSGRVTLVGPARPVVIEAGPGTPAAAPLPPPRPAAAPQAVHYTEPEIVVEGH